MKKMVNFHWSKRKKIRREKKELKGFDEQMDDFSKNFDSAMYFDLDLGVFGDEKDKNKKEKKMSQKFKYQMMI